MKVTETISDNDDVNEKNGVDDKDVHDNDRYVNHISVEDNSKHIYFVNNKLEETEIH